MLDEAAQELERGATGADDHRRSELGDGHAVRGQLSTSLLPAREVGREAAGGVAQPAEIDDVAHAGLAGGLAEPAGSSQVSQLEVRLPAGHRVGQVVGRIDALERGRQGALVEQVDGDDLGFREALLQASRVTAGEPKLMTVGREKRDQAATDIAAGTDDEDAHVCGRL